MSFISKVSKITSLLVLGFSYSTISSANVTCTEPLFGGGPVLANVINHDGTTAFKIGSSIGERGFPRFIQFDGWLRDGGVIGANDHVELISTSGVETTACSNSSAIPALVGCGTIRQVPVVLTVWNSASRRRRDVTLQSQSISFSTARRVYERASGAEINREYSYDVELHLELTLPNGQTIFPGVSQSFHGEEGCVGE